jgi:uncharacterized protein (DUF2249 family)
LLHRKSPRQALAFQSIAKEEEEIEEKQEWDEKKLRGEGVYKMKTRRRRSKKKILTLTKSTGCGPA